MVSVRTGVQNRMAQVGVAIPLFLIATLCTSVALYIATVTPDTTVRTTATGIFLLGLLGQGLAIAIGSARATRTMLGVSVGLLLIAMGAHVVGPQVPANPHRGIRNVVRGFAVASILASLGYLAHRITAGPTGN